MGYRQQRTASPTRGRSGNVVQAASRATHAVNSHRDNAAPDRVLHDAASHVALGSIAIASRGVRRRSKRDMSRGSRRPRRRGGAPPAHPSCADASLPRVAAVASPAVNLLVALLAPWDRARLRLTCRALADAVPVAACAPTLSAMAVRGGGAGLLRYGAGGARPHLVHCQIAADADTADALRWLVGRVAVSQRDAWGLQYGALLAASGDAWRVASALPSLPGAFPALLLAAYAILGGSEALAAECAARAAEAAGSFRGLEPSVLRDVLNGAALRNFPGVLAALRRLRGANVHPARDDDDDHGHDAYGMFESVALTALAMGRGDLVEPCDWDALFEPMDLLRAAVRSGDVAAAEALLPRCAEPAADTLHRELLPAAMQCRGDAGAMLDWVASRTSVGAERLVRKVRCSLEGASGKYRLGAVDDRIGALRWLAERGGFVRATAMLAVACRSDAVSCAEYLVGGLGARPTTEMLGCALAYGSYRVAAFLAVRVGPLDAAAFVRLVNDIPSGPHAVRAMALLRRHGLLPAPDPVFLRECVCRLRARPQQLGALAAAGYRVDGDAREWIDSVRPHCAGTPLRQWRPLAYMLRRRFKLLAPRRTDMDAPLDG